MPSRSPRLPFPRQVVTAVLVVHDGAPRLAGCLEAIREQRRRPQRLVVVDTGSVDGSADVVAGAADDIVLVRLPRDTGFPAAVAAGLAAADASPAPRRRAPVTDRVWLLHDDSRPEPEALHELLAEAERSESATVLGCKQVDLDGIHLVEMGVTVDASGRRRTGLDAHEVDQGQHDEFREVLAVSTAGMLVRRDVWDRLGGLDATWPLFGDDIDFGWRANAAGERVVVVPAAVVRHDFALSTGRRNADALGDTRPQVARRRHGMQVLLANTAAPLVPLLVVRAVLSGLVASAGRLLGGQLRAAADELAILGSTLRSLPAIAAARRRRRLTRVRPHREIRPLLARGSAPGRRDMDAWVARWRRGRRSDARDQGWRDRPLLWLTLTLLVVALVADRGLFGGPLHGGRLLPAPAGASDLWSMYTAGWHGVGIGSTSPTPPWVAALAALSTILFGKPWLVVDLLMLGAVPLAGWTAYAAGSAVSRSRWLRAAAAAAYALLPVTTGAVAGGRLDVVVVVVLLPVTAWALVRAVRPDDRSPSLPVAAGLLLAVGVAFAPLLWAVVGVVGLAVIVASIRPLGGAVARLLLALGAVFLALLPWSWSLAAHPSLAVRGWGLADTFALPRPQAVGDLVLLHPGGSAQPPAWLLVGYVLAAVAALLRNSQRALSRAAFTAFVVAVAAAVAATRLDVPGGGDTTRYWTGVPLAVASMAAVCCAVVAADGARSALARHAFGWRQIGAGLVTVAVAVAGVGAAVMWMGRGAAQPLTARNAQLLPAFAAATVGLPTAPRALVLRARPAGVGYALVRSSAGPQLGDADLAAETTRSARAARVRLGDAVARLTAGDPDAAPLLTEFGITQVVTRVADDRSLSGLLRVDGLTPVPTSAVVVRRAAASAGELVVLEPGAAGQVRAGQPPAASARPAALPSHAGRATIRLRPGPGGRLLVLAEPVDRHWRATLDGRPLRRATAYGWAQAWQLPVTGGRLDVSRMSDGRGRRLLLQLGVLVALVLAARPRRGVTGADA